MVSTKTLYNYIDQCLLEVRKNCRVLGTSIAERPPEIEDREEFGHGEIDTVEGKKSDDNAVLTLLERKSRNYYIVKIDDQEHDSVDYAIKQLQSFYGVLFPQVFKPLLQITEVSFPTYQRV